MNAKELILEIFREADFISETLNQKTKEEAKDQSPELLSASAIKRRPAERFSTARIRLPMWMVFSAKNSN